MQALLFIMVYGTWSGDHGLFQDALAFQSRLAHVRHLPAAVVSVHLTLILVCTFPYC